MLVKDVEIIQPYLKTVMPLLKATLTDPVPEVVREGANADGDARGAAIWMTRCGGGWRRRNTLPPGTHAHP